MDKVVNTMVVHFPLVKLTSHFYVPKEIRWPQLAWHSSSFLKVDSIMAFLSLALQSKNCC